MVNPTPRRIDFVGKAGTDYFCVRRLSDGQEWELTLAQFAALKLQASGAPVNVSAGAYNDAQWAAAWQATELTAYRDWAWNTPNKRLAFADVGIGPDDKLRIGLGNGLTFTMWPSSKAEAAAVGLTWTGNNVNNITLVNTSGRALPFTLVSGILSLT